MLSWLFVFNTGTHPHHRQQLLPSLSSLSAMDVPLVYLRNRRAMAASNSNTKAAKRHIEKIRAQKFSIGERELNPLTQDLHHAVTRLSAELCTKDVHFLMELIQNAEDNEYGESVEPTLEFVLTKEDITETGAPATLLVFNNEVGFSRKNMDSLCSVGRSTKKGK